MVLLALRLGEETQRFIVAAWIFPAQKNQIRTLPSRAGENRSPPDGNRPQHCANLMLCDFF
jgi:hypothetical protein